MNVGGKRGRNMVTKFCMRAGRDFYRLFPSLFPPNKGGPKNKEPSLDGSNEGRGV